MSEQETKTFDEAYVKDLRTEAANYRVQLREKEQELETLKGSWENKQMDSLKKEVEFAAKQAGAVDPSVAAQLIDINTIEKDEEGNFIGVEDKVKGLLEEKPFLKGGDIGRPSNPVGGNGQPKIFTRAEVDRMSQDEINSNWADIQEQLSKNLIR